MVFDDNNALPLIKTDGQRKEEIWDLTLLTKSMREEMRNVCCRGWSSHSRSQYVAEKVGKRTEGKTTKKKKNNENLKSARGGTVWRSKQRREIRLGKTGTPTEWFSCSCEPLRGNEWFYRHIMAEAEMRLNAAAMLMREGGKYSCAPEQSTVKASLVLTLNSAAGFTWHSGKSKGMFWLGHVNNCTEKRQEYFRLAW